MAASEPPVAYAYPKPLETPINSPFLRAWREQGILLVQNCDDCNHVFFYPRPFCPKCFSKNITWVTTNGRGSILTFTQIHRPNHPSFFAEVPIVFAEIALDNGANLLSRVIGENRTQINTRAAVILAPGSANMKYPLPPFILE